MISNVGSSIPRVLSVGTGLLESLLLESLLLESLLLESLLLESLCEAAGCGGTPASVWLASGRSGSRLDEERFTRECLNCV